MPKFLPILFAAISQIFALMRERIAERREATQAATASYARVHARISDANTAMRAALRAHMRHNGDDDLDHEFRRQDDV